jgi:hypothetical protein
MRKTLFAGLTELDPSDSLAEDGYAFQQKNPRVTDHFLEIGAVTHRHDAHLPLADPTVAPSAAASGGCAPTPTTTR